MKHINKYKQHKSAVNYYPSQDQYEREQFILYLLQFYEESDYFKGLFTRKTVEKYIDAFINKRKKFGVWGGGDSFDREYFRDMMLIKLDIWYDTEYDVTPYLTKKEQEELPIKKNVNKYNL